MDDLGARAVLKRFVTEHGTQRAAAVVLEISEPYLSDLLRGRRPFSDRILAKLGLARTITVLRQKTA